MEGLKAAKAALEEELQLSPGRRGGPPPDSVGAAGVDAELVAGLRAELERLQAELAEMPALREKAGQVDELQEIIASLQAQYDDSEGQVMQLEAALHNKAAQAEQLQQQLAAAEQAGVQQQHAEVEQLQQQLAAAAAEAEVAQQRLLDDIAGLQAQLDVVHSTTDEVGELRILLAEAQEGYRQVSAQLAAEASTQSELQLVKEQLAEAQEGYQQLSAQLAEAQEGYQQASAQLAAEAGTQSELRLAKEQLAEAQEGYQQVSAQLAAESMQLQSFLAELAAAQQQLGQAQEGYQQVASLLASEREAAAAAARHGEEEAKALRQHCAELQAQLDGKGQAGGEWEQRHNELLEKHKFAKVLGWVEGGTWQG